MNNIYNDSDDYNDKNVVPDWNNGQIHGWNGGDCPVHPETLVNYWLRNMAIATETYRASGLRWTHRDESGDIIAFQVVKAYVEPKVIWVNEYRDGYRTTHDTERKAKHTAGHSCKRIAVKYVEAIAGAKEVKE